MTSEHMHLVFFLFGCVAGWVTSSWYSRDRPWSVPEIRTTIMIAMEGMGAIDEDSAVSAKEISDAVSARDVFYVARTMGSMVEEGLVRDVGGTRRYYLNI